MKLHYLLRDPLILLTEMRKCTKLRFDKKNDINSYWPVQVNLARESTFPLLKGTSL